MKTCYLIHTALVVSFASTFLVGCSIRTVPLEEEQGVYEDGYYQEHDSLSPSLFYDTWQWSQYYQYYGYAPGLGYLPPYQMNIDPNPSDSYRTDEKPIQHAPAQTSVQGQGTAPNRRVGERRASSAFQQRINRSRRVHPNRLAASSKSDSNRFREQLRQRQRTTNTVDDDGDRKAQRRTIRRRAKR